MTLDYPEPRVAHPTYGRNLIASLPRSLRERPIVLTQPEPWAVVRGYFPETALQLHMVTSMEYGQVIARAGAFGPGSAVFGIGGGSALDHAKFVAWKTGLPLILVPSILSVDAAYTKAIAVRDGSRVRYVGEVYPEFLLIDYGLLQHAPAVLNRAGAGDILSIVTALWDWREAGVRLGEKYDPAIAAAAQDLVDRLYQRASQLREVTSEGLYLLSELYRGEVRLCEMAGNSRPEEGSEHYIAYCLESLTQRSCIHGRLVGLCILLAGRYQGQEVGPVCDFLKELDLDCSLHAVGTTHAEIRHTLLSMGEYVRQETALMPGVFHFRDGISEEETDDLLASLSEVIG